MSKHIFCVFLTHPPQKKLFALFNRHDYDDGDDTKTFSPFLLTPHRHCRSCHRRSRHHCSLDPQFFPADFEGNLLSPFLGRGPTWPPVKGPFFLARLLVLGRFKLLCYYIEDSRKTFVSLYSIRAKCSVNT